MRTLFVMSLACALMSLLAVLGLSAMTIVPRPGAENARALTMLGTGAFGVAWLCLAFRLRARQRAAAPPLPPWSRRLLVGVSVVYLLCVLSLVMG